MGNVIYVELYKLTPTRRLYLIVFSCKITIVEDLVKFAKVQKKLSGNFLVDQF